MKNFLEITVLIMMIGLVLFIGYGVTKYDDDAHKRAVSWAEQIEKSHIYSGDTYVDQVCPGIYKVYHENGAIDKLRSKGVTDNEYYISSFVDFTINDIKALID